MSTASPKDQSTRDDAAIRALIDGVHEAHHDKDAAAIAAPYARDAVVFDLAPPLARSGIDVRDLKAWLDTWEGRLDLESHDFKITVSGDLAFCHGFYRLCGTSKASGQPAIYWWRATVCLVREEGAWRIVHEHTSVPFYMDGSFRAAVDLAP